MVPHAVGHEKLRLFRPSVVALCQFDFGLAQRLAVSSTRILLVRSSVADMAVDDDQGRTITTLVESMERAFEHLVVCANVLLDGERLAADGQERGLKEAACLIR